MFRDATNLYPAALQMNEKQYVERNQASQRQDFYTEKIRRSQDRLVGPDKIGPARRPVGGRWYPMSS